MSSENISFTISYNHNDKLKRKYNYMCFGFGTPYGSHMNRRGSGVAVVRHSVQPALDTNIYPDHENILISNKA
jgi:hypothetical protein